MNMRKWYREIEFIEVIETSKERRLKKFLFHDWIIPMLD